MSLNNFSTDTHELTINGRPVEDWGEAATPVTHDPIDQQSTLRRGQGGNAVRLDRLNPGRVLVLNLNPGGADSAYMQGLMNSKATITCSMFQIGTGESAVGTEGVIINDGSVGRAGQTITDDQYTIQFNVWTGSKGSV